MQKTIRNSVSYSGIGLHSGAEVKINFKPGSADSGIIFRRIDLKNCPQIKANPDSVVSTNRSTSIGRKKNDNFFSVKTIEHIMAVLWGMDIDNIVIEINGPEFPIADGSGFPLVELIKKGRVKTLNFARKIKVIENSLWKTGQEEQIVILPYNGFKINYTLDFDHPLITTQFYEFDANEDSFIKEIAKARTFGFVSELEFLQENGLAQGGSLNNAILIGEKEIKNTLRFPDELVRHKVLDIIGDLYLNGFIRGQIIAIKSGHSSQVELSKEIYKNIGESSTVVASVK